MWASVRRRLLGALAEARKQLALHPDLKHLDDGQIRWHFGDDPQEGDPDSEVW